MIRKANLKDAKKIQELINYYANQDEMLPRSISEIYENIRGIFVFVEKGCKETFHNLMIISYP